MENKGTYIETQIDESVLRLALDQTKDAVLIRDLEDRVLFWNQGAERLYGWEASEAVGQNIYDLLCQRHVPGIGGTGTLHESGERAEELRQTTKDRREITVESRSTVIYDKDGDSRLVVIVNTDITEKKTLEFQFLRAQRMECIGKLASGIVHDLNNTLAPMLVATHVLQQKHIDSESQALLETLRANAERSGHLINQLLTFAKGIAGERVSIQFGDVIRETVDILRRVFPKSIAIKTEIAPDLWTIAGNPTHMHQVIMNLCVNAREAMPNGGTLVIEADNVILDRPERANYIGIRVTDTGDGIPAEIVDRIFEAFFTTKEKNKGTGLGLSTVLNIAQSHQGFVSVASEPGRGAQFEVFLPAEESQIQPTPHTYVEIVEVLTNGHA